jgi:hypothetical protein
VGALRPEFPVPMAPIAPEPFVPVMSTPEKEMTETVSIFVGAIGDKQGLKPPLEMPMQAIGATQGKLRSVPTSAGSVSFRQDLDRNEVPTVIGWRGII